jgi:hypothetical protein
MANTDSFIDEVSEEVRRDRLFSFFRKWAWLAVLDRPRGRRRCGLFRIPRAQTEATAEAFGDSLIAALEADGPRGARRRAGGDRAADAGRGGSDRASRRRARSPRLMTGPPPPRGCAPPPKARICADVTVTLRF